MTEPPATLAEQISPRRSRLSLKALFIFLLCLARGPAAVIGFLETSAAFRRQADKADEAILQAARISVLDDRQVIAGVPALMNVPILGSLFRSRDYQRDETELMIVVTPYIARPLNPEDIARPDDGLADATDPQGWFLGRVNRLYSTTTNPQALHNFKGRVGFIND